MALTVTYKGILKLALPISIGTFIQFLVVSTDNLFLSMIDKNVMNGAGNGSLMYVTLLMLLMGLASGVQVLIARRNGERNFLEAGALFANALYISLLFAVGMFILLQVTGRFFLDDLIESPAVRSNMGIYLNIRSIGILIYFFTICTIGFYTGIARTMVVLYATVITAGLNMLLDYALILGNFGMPEMGIQGAAWATVISELVATVFVILFMFRDKKLRKFGILGHLKRVPLYLSSRIMKISWPLMIQQTISFATWTFFFFIIERTGEDNLQISHVIRTLYMLVFVSAMGFGQATKSIISTLIAEQRQKELMSSIRKLILANVIGVLLLSHGLWLYPDYISELFNLSPAVFEDARKSMLVILFSMFLAAFSSILLNTIIGTGKTMVGFVIEIVAVVFYLSSTYYVTVVAEWPIYKIWMNDYIYFGVILILSFLYIKNSNWKYMKV